MKICGNVTKGNGEDMGDEQILKANEAFSQRMEGEANKQKKKFLCDYKLQKGYGKQQTPQ